MRYAWAVVVVLCLAVSAVWAQGIGGAISSRSLGMGGAAIGVADDAAAWYQNPAGLAALSVPVQDGNDWGVDVMGLYVDIDSENGWGILGSGWAPAKRLGFGAGYGDVEDTSVYGAGFGIGIGRTDLSAGLSVTRFDEDSRMVVAQTGYSDDSYTLLNLGLLYQVRRPEAAPVRLGLVVADVTDETNAGPMFDFGVAWPVTPEWLAAADVLDISDETGDGPYFSFGAEYKPVKLANWAFRAGVLDSGDSTDLTVGAGYAWERWRLDAAYGDMADGVWSVTAAASF